MIPRWFPEPPESGGSRPALPYGREPPTGPHRTHPKTRAQGTTQGTTHPTPTGAPLDSLWQHPHQRPPRLATTPNDPPHHTHHHTTRRPPRCWGDPVTGVGVVSPREGEVHPVSGRVAPPGRVWCHARNRSGKQCGHLAIPGGRVCAQRHGGSAPQVARKAGERLARQRVEGSVGAIVEELQLDAAGMDPVEILLVAVRRSHAMATVLDWLVGDLPSLTVTTDDGGGHPDVAVQLLREWNDAAARHSKLALDAGVEERRVRLAESDVTDLVGVLRGVASGLLEVACAVVPGAADALRAAWADSLAGLVDRELAPLTGGGA